MNVYKEYFSDDYFQARKRFREQATAIGCHLEHRDVDDNNGDLKIDVAEFGPSESDNVCIVISGLHGIEGYMGSAIQLHYLAEHAASPQQSRFAFIHAANPFGFANLRRCDADNVDLNRNFLLGSETYCGSPPRYKDLDSMLNPPSRHQGGDFFTLKALARIALYGMQALKESIATGQYDFPKGLFFGGNELSSTSALIAELIAQVAGGASRIAVVDLHSGLGAFGSHKVMLNTHDEVLYAKFASMFDQRFVERFGATDGVAYQARGTLGDWVLDRFDDRQTLYGMLEMGTYHSLRILSSMRAENQAHFYNDRDDETYHQVKAELKECFCPENETWRRTATTVGCSVIKQIAGGLVSPSTSS